MKKLVFDYLDYKRYLREYFASKPGGGRGYRAQLADAIGIQRTFLSQVLQKDLHFSLEQGRRLSRHLAHTPDETRYFLFAIQFARAGSQDLREFFLDEMKAIISQRLIISSRLKNEKKLQYDDEVRYYSSWLYQAIRCAVSIPSFRTAEALSKRLGISTKKVVQALAFLASSGLIEKKGDEYHPGVLYLHLNDDSTIRIKRHSSWLLRSLSALEDQREQDIHFSGVLTLSQEDALAIKSMIVNQIEAILKKAQPSPEETLYSFCLDYFEL